MLALAAGADMIAPPAMMRLWAAQLPDMEFVTVAEAGHALSYEDPAAFNACVESFLRRRGEHWRALHPAEGDWAPPWFVATEAAAFDGLEGIGPGEVSCGSGEGTIRDVGRVVP